MRRAAVLFGIGTLLWVLPAFAEQSAPAPAAAVQSLEPHPWSPLTEPAELEPTLPSRDGVETAKADVPVEELSLGWTLLRTFVVLGIVIAAVYLTLNFGLRKLMGVGPAPRGPGVVTVVERIPLDQKRAMFVVKAAGEYLLIGGGDGALQLITKLDASEVERLHQQRPPSLALSPLLQKLLKRREGPVKPASGDPS